MEVSITQFRRQMFDLVKQAMDGAEVWVVHKGRRFRIVPEGKPVNKLDRITPMKIALVDLDKAPSMLPEMQLEWEKDWKTL
jgi:prevent-host-death family protein